MSLDADGKVTSLTIKPGRVKELLREQLEKAILLWDFEPGLLNGKPAATETTLFVSFTVSLNVEETGYDVVIDRVSTGAIVKFMSRPKHPQSGGYPDVGLVVLDIDYNKEGKPTRVAVTETSPVKKGRLVTSAVKSVESWTFEPERVAGHGVSGRSYQPICFTTDRQNAHCSWTPPGSDAPTTSDQSVALDSQVRLKSDVVGKTI